MNRNLSNKSVFVLLVLFGLLIPYKVQSQVQTSIAEVVTPPEEFPMTGIIYPQFWRATLKDQLVFVPLDKVISFGIQDYDVTGGGHVHELSIALDSQVMVRIYAVEPPKIVDKVKERTSNTQSRVEGLAGKVSPVSNIQTDSVVKHYPETTHKFMMEYRVSKRKAVDQLYSEFETAFMNFRMRELTASQRPSAIHNSKVVDGAL